MLVAKDIMEIYLVAKVQNKAKFVKREQFPVKSLLVVNASIAVALSSLSLYSIIVTSHSHGSYWQCRL